MMRQTKAPALNTAPLDNCTTDSTEFLANAAADKDAVNDVR